MDRKELIEQKKKQLYFLTMNCGEKVKLSHTVS